MIYGHLLFADEFQDAREFYLVSVQVLLELAQGLMHVLRQDQVTLGLDWFHLLLLLSGCGLGLT